MSLDCALCDRTFEEQRHLEQHLRTSFLHAERIQARLQSSNAQSGGRQAEYQPARKEVSPSTPLQAHDTSRSEQQTKPAEPMFEAMNPIAPMPTSLLDSSRWSKISYNESHLSLKLLTGHCHSLEELEASSFLVRPYGLEDFAHAPRKCTRCNASDRPPRQQLSQKMKLADPEAVTVALVKDGQCFFHRFKRNKYVRLRPVHSIQDSHSHDRTSTGRTNAAPTLTAKAVRLLRRTISRWQHAFLDMATSVRLRHQMSDSPRLAQWCWTARWQALLGMRLESPS